MKSWTHSTCLPFLDRGASCQLASNLMDDLNEVLKRGREAHARGDIATAEACYLKILASLPQQPDVLDLLGLVYFARAEFARARTNFEASLAARPGHAATLMHLGSALHEMKLSAEALAVLDQALVIAPEHAELHYNIGVVAQYLGDADRALRHYQKEMALRPGAALSAANLALLHAEAGNHGIAVPLFEQALQRHPENLALWNALGSCRQVLRDTDGARACFEIALRLKPTDSETIFNLANLDQDHGQCEKAISAYSSLRGIHRSELYYLYFARALLAECRHMEFDEILDEGMKLYPSSPALAVEKALALPRIYATQDEIRNWRRRYASGLEQLIRDTASGKFDEKKLLKILDHRQNFYLAYQGENDCDLQKMYGRWHTELAAKHWKPPAADAVIPSMKSSPDKIRVAYISANFTHHSVTHTTVGYLQKADRSRFHITTYFLGDTPDSATELFRQASDVFKHLPRNINRIVTEIAQDKIDILFLADVGMSGIMSALAARRLAPIQCTTQGHPETTGYPHMDYYVISDLMEPEDAQDHYSEKLVRLKDSGLTYPRPQIMPSKLSRTDLGLDNKTFIYLCCQSLFKYAPRHDSTVPRILEKVPGSVAIFIEGKTSAENRIFRSRMDAACHASGVDSTRVKLISRMKLSDLFSLYQMSDVFLDSIPWSGENTLLEAWSVADLPCVTLPGLCMRHRHCLCFCKLVGIEDCIAGDIASYIATAVRLAQDVTFYQSVSRRIAGKKETLYDDESATRDLENHFREWIKTLPQSPT